MENCFEPYVTIKTLMRSGVNDDINNEGASEDSKYATDRSIVQNAFNGDCEPLAYYLQNSCSYAFKKVLKLYADNNIDKSSSDLINDTYILLSNKNWKKLRTYNFKAQLKSWLSPVIHYHFLNKLKKELKEKDHLSSLVYETIPQETMFDEKNSNRQKIEKAINQLTNPKEKAVLRYMLLEYHDEVIAARMNISKNNVYVIRCRAKIKLNRLLNEKR